MTKSLGRGRRWCFLPGRGKPVPAPGKRTGRFRFHQQPIVGAGKTLLSPLGACQLPLTWAGGGVWRSIHFQKHADRTMHFREWKQLECYKELIDKTRAIKMGAVCVILAHVARGGQKGDGQWWGRAAEPSSICQQGGVLPGLGFEEALHVLRAASSVPSLGKLVALWPASPGGPGLHARARQPAL